MKLKGLNAIHSNGDPNLFQSLFDGYFSALCLYTLRFTKDKSAAQEIVHETFVKLWEQREYIEINESLPGYLYKSVRNNALNYLKSEQIRNKYNEAYAEKLRQAQEYFTITRESGLSVILAKELETKILEAVDSLPVKCKEIFKLSRYDGLKNSEIAAIKQVTLNTVQKQISIALEKLRKSLGAFLPKMVHLLIFIDMAGSMI